MSAATCPACATEYGSSALACPHCHRLVHSDELKALAAQADQARQSGDASGERQAWDKALGLLPRDSQQRLKIEKRVAELADAPAGPAAAAPGEPRPQWTKGSGVLGGLAFLAWKLKGVLLLGLGKLKFLMLGLSKASTLFSFLASFGVYWTLWGWRYALGFLIAMYIHEMGHVAALRRFGIPASAPMFVPGLGAFVRMNQRPSTVGEDARIGLAGPEWGFGAAVAAYICYWLTGAPIWAAIGHSAAYLNLFNLIPIWQLDGSRGFAALTTWHRVAIAAAFAVAWAVTREGVVGLITCVAIFRLFTRDAAPKSDVEVLARFVWLIAAFATMLKLSAGGVAGR